MSNKIEPSILHQPPNWSPTGNSGFWIWDKEGKRECWRWYDDVYGYDKPPSTTHVKVKKKSWIKKIIGL